MKESFIIVNAMVYRTEERDFLPGTVEVKNGVITSVVLGTDRDMKCVSSADLPVIDAHGKYLVPGLVDVHTHGRIGYDFDSADAAQMREMRASYASDGTTTVLPTIASAPLDKIEHSIDCIKEVGFDGVHLEGRYLNVKRRGAHSPELLFPLGTEELTSLLDRMDPLPIKHITCAAELEGGEAFVKTALSHGATVGIGHTDATYEEAMNAIAWGVTSFTHTFNAMRPIHHREPGVITAGLTTENAYCEAIADGFHLHPAVIRLLYQAKKPDHLVLITDSMCAAKCPDGDYSIGGIKVFVRDGKAINVEGAIAGSTITLYTAVLNLMRFADISFADALACATINPARMTGLDALTGSVAEGKRADLLIVDPETYGITDIFAAGCRVPVSGTVQ